MAAPIYNPGPRQRGESRMQYTARVHAGQRALNEQYRQQQIQRQAAIDAANRANAQREQANRTAQEQLAANKAEFARAQERWESEMKIMQQNSEKNLAALNDQLIQQQAAAKQQQDNFNTKFAQQATQFQTAQANAQARYEAEMKAQQDQADAAAAAATDRFNQQQQQYADAQVAEQKRFDLAQLKAQERYDAQTLAFNDKFSAEQQARKDEALAAQARFDQAQAAALEREKRAAEEAQGRFDAAQASFREREAAAAARFETAQAAYAEQVQRTQRLATAYVPQAQNTAQGFNVGDSRPTQRTRQRSRNSLSTLSILSAPDQSGNAQLSGLQIA